MQAEEIKTTLKPLERAIIEALSGGPMSGAIERTHARVMELINNEFKTLLHTAETRGEFSRVSRAYENITGYKIREGGAR